MEENKLNNAGSAQETMSQRQNLESISLQMETLERKYLMDKTVWNERLKIKEEEIKTIKGMVNERETVLKNDFRKKEEEISQLRQKTLELESKVSLEQSLTQEKIKLKEEEIKELKARFSQYEGKLKEEIISLEFKYNLKNQESERLGNLVAQRERELNSQIQWKQQELSMEKARFEDEMRKLTAELRAVQMRTHEELSENNREITLLRARMANEVNELKIKYEQEQKHSELLSVRIEEIQKDRYRNEATVDVLARQVEQMRNENKILREASYLPENSAKLRFIDSQEEISGLKIKLSAIQSELILEKENRNNSLKQREEEIQRLKEKNNEHKQELTKGSVDNSEQLKQEKEKLELAMSKLIEDKANELFIRQKLLHEKEEIYTNFIDDMARGFIHRIRNLLGIIGGAVEICAGTLPDNMKKFEPTKNIADNMSGKNKVYAEISEVFKQYKENFDMATEHVAVTLKEIDEFRDLSKPIEIKKQKINIENYIKTLINSLEERARNQKVQFSQEYNSTIKEASIDPEKFDWALKEILNNAFEAMSSGGTIKIQVSSENDNMMKISITDNGIGIPSTQIGKVFQPFFTNKANRPGSGLPKVKRIVALHDGTTAVQSEKGKWTTVDIKFAVN